jgi:hypothetical protein
MLAAIVKVVRDARILWILLGMSAASAGAQDGPAPARPVVAPPPGDAIEAARQQFELLESARNGGSQPKTALPRVAMPELHSAPPESPLRTSSVLKPEPEFKTGNWLVEAMERTRDSRQESETGGRGERVRRADREPLDGLEKSAGEKRGGADSERTREPQESASGFNPLAPYLSQWMTPQDYALLGPAIERNARTGDLLRGHVPMGTAGVLEIGAGTTARNVPGGSAAAARPLPVRPPAENPYLQTLNTFSVPSAGPAPAPATPRAVAPPGPPPVYPAPASAPAPKSHAPDFIKSQADEKYFKQLKRF